MSSLVIVASSGGVYQSNDGVATKIFTSFGLTPVEWLGDKDVVIYSIFLVLT